MKKLLYLFISLAFTAVSFAQVQIVSVDTTGESCEGADDGRIFITTTSGALPITYFVSGGSFNTTIIQNFDTLTVKNLPAQNYVVVAQDINGDFDFRSFDISSGRSISTPIITSNAPLCLNNILTFSAASDAGVSYQWTGPNSFTSTNQSFFIPNVTAANAGNYDVYATALGRQAKVCSSAVATRNVVISPVPNSSFTISKASPCVNEDITLTASAQSGAAYNWIPSGGGNIGGPLGQDHIKIARWSTSGTKNVSLQVDNNGCLSTITTRLVNVVNQPQGVISGIDTICIGQSSNLTITFTGTAPWIYTYNNAGTPTTINTSNNPETIVVSPSVTTNYFGTSINDAQCAGVPTGLATIKVNSAPSASIKDTTIAVCNGISTIIPISFSGTAPFNFQYTDGTTIFSDSSNTISSSITVNPTISTTYSLVSVTDGICSGTVSGTTVINVSPTPTSTFTIPSTSCLSSDVTVTYTGSASPTASYNWNFGGGVVVSGSNQGPHQIRWLTTGPKTVRLTVSENGCTSTQTTNNITILTRPDVRLITSNQSICAGNSVTLSFLSSGGTAPYTYQFTDGTTTFSRTTSSVLSTSLVSPSTTSTYSIVSVGDANCINGTFSGTTVVTVRPLPTSTFSVSPAGLCTNQAATITYTGTGNAGATYNWTFTGGTPASATGQGPHNVSWSVPSTNNVSLSVVQSSCSSAVTVIPITIIDRPIATISGTNTICNGSASNLSVSFTGTAPYNFTYSDGTSSTNISTSSNPHIIAVSPSSTRTYNITAFNDNNCSGTFTGSATVTVNPTPTLNISSASSICSGSQTNILLSSTPLGATFSYTASGTGTTTGFSNGTASPIQQTISGIGNVSYIITPTLGTCVGNPSNFTISVSPPSTVSTISPTTICSGTSTNLVLTSFPTGASFTYTASGSGTVTGFSDGTGSPIQQTLTGTGTVDYEVTPTIGGCVGVPSTISVTVNPNPTVSISSPSAICSGSQTNVLLTTTPPGGTFSYTASGTGTTSGFSNGSGSPIQQTLTGSGNVTYIITPTLGTCVGNPTNFIIAVNPLSTVSTASPTTICSGAQTNIALTSSPSGASFNYTASGTGSVAGFSNGTGSPIQQTLTGVGTVDYLVTPTIGGCTGTPSTITVTVNTAPTVSISSPSAICSGSQTNVLLTSTPSGGTFSYTASGTGTTSGFSNGSGSPIQQTLTGSGNVTYIITPSLGTCVGNPTNFIIAVNPPSTVSTASPTTICSGSQTNIALTSSPSGAIFNYTASGTGSVAGFSNGTGSPIQQTLTGDGTVDYLVTPTIGGCTGTPSTITVVVNANPTVSTASPTNICSGSQTNLVLNSSPSGASYTYTASLASGTVSGFSNGSGSPIQQTLTGNGTVDYLIVPSLSGCIGTANTISVNVNNGVTVSTSSPTSICSGSQTNLVLTSTPAGASYSYTTSSTGTVSGFSNGFGSPIQQTLVGNGTVTYLVTPSLGSCVGTPFAITVTVDPPSTVSTVSPTSICTGAQTNLVLTSSPVGATFNYTTSSTGTVSGFSDGSGSPIIQTLTGTGTVTYAVTPSFGGCLGTTSNIVVTVNLAPTASFLVLPACVNTNTSVQYFGSAPPSASFNWDFGGATLVPPGTGIGPHSVSWNTPGNKTVTLQVTENGCTSSLNSVVVAVNSAPDVTISGDTTLCQGGSPILYFNFNGIAPFDFTYSDGSNPFLSNSPTDNYAEPVPTPPGLGATTYQVTSLTDASGCTGTFTGTAVVNVGTAPTASIIGDTSVCTGSPAFVRIKFNGVAPFSYTYDDGSGPISATTNNSIEVINIASLATDVNYTLSNVKDANCDAVISKSTAVMSITPGPDASFIVLPACVNTNTSIQYLGSPTTTSFNWDFGGATVVPPGTGIGPHSVSWNTPGNKTVTLQVTENGCTSSLNSVVVAVNIAPDVTISGDTTLCQGGSPILYFNFNGIAPYDFTYSDGTNTFTENAPSNSFAISPTTPPSLGTTTYQVTSLTDASSCTGTFTGTAVVNVIAAPTASITNDTTICEGADAFVKLSFSGLAPFTYTYNDGVKDSTVTTNNSVEIINIPAVLANVTYTLVAMSDVNCDAIITSNTASITIVTKPIAAFDASNPIVACLNNDVTFTYTGAPVTSYQWGFDNPTTISDPDLTTAGPYAASWNTLGVKNIYLIVSDGSCVSDTAKLALTIQNAPTAVITGDTTVCSGNFAILKVAFTGTPIWILEWIDEQGTPKSKDFTVANDTIMVNPLSTYNYEFSQVTDAALCPNTIIPSKVNVNVEDTPTPDFSVSPPVSCGNSDVLVKYQSVIDPEMKFVWDFDSQSSSVPTANPQEYNIQWNTSGIKNLQVTVTDTLTGCSASVGNSVTINPIVSATLSGNDTVCSGTSASKIQVSFTGVKPWIFTYNVNGSPVTDTADVTPYLIPTNPTVNSNYSLASVIDSNNCSGSVSGTSDVIVKLLPDATLRIKKTGTICLGDTVVLQALLKVGTPSWTLIYSDSSSLGINIDTLNSNSVVDSIAVSPTVYTVYKVISVTDASGCTALLNDEQPPSVDVNSLPIASFVVNPSAVCLDQNVTITFTGDVLINPTYSWQFDNNTLPLDSTLVGPHIAQYNTTGNKTIRLILKNNDTGCLSDTAFGNVLIQGAPTAVISGDTTICSGTQAFIKVVSTGTAPFTVNYFDESGPTQVTLNNLTDYISVSPNNPFNYQLDSITDNIGCKNTSIPGSVQVDVNASPVANMGVSPEAVCLGNTTEVSYTGDFDNIKLGWDFSGGDSIRNSLDIYDVSWSTSGLKPITVIATDTNGCSGSATELVEVYPNPVATITGNDTVCNGVNASNIIINFTSGTKPWIFSYDDGSIKQDTASSSPYVFNVSPSDTTVYSLISVSDSNSCTNIATGTATVVVRPTPEFEFSQSQSICLGDQAPLVGNLKIGIPNWSLIYQDSSSNGIVQDTVLFTKNIDTFFVSPIVTSKYKVVRGFDASGCDAIYDDEQSSPIIIVSPKPSTTFNITPGKCLADTIIATYTGTSPSANFTWDFGGGSSAKPINDVGPHSLLYPNSGLKKVKLTVEENGCSVTDSAVTNINPSPTATLINNGLSTVCAGDNVVLDLTFTAGVPPFKYTYREGNTTKTDSTVNSVANIASNPIDTIVFRLLTIQDATCNNISNDSVVVNVKPLPTIIFTGLASGYCDSQGEITFSSNRLDTFRIAPATSGFTNLVGLGQGKFNPSTAGIGLYVISQSHIGANGCTNTRNQDVLVDNPPTSADFDFDSLYCAGVDTVLFPNANFGVFTIVPATGLAFNDTTGSIFPIQSTFGTYIITNTVDGGACPSVSAKDTVVIYPQAGLPIIANLADTLSCSQDSSVITYKLTPVTGNTYEWNVFGGTIKGDSILDSVVVKWNKLSIQKSVSLVASNKFCFDTSSFAVYVDTIVIDVRYVTDSIGNDNVIQLNWLAASSVNPNDSVFIYRRTNLPDLGPWETIAKVPMSVSFVNYIDTTNTLLTGLISYEYRVGAINACGDTLFSAAHRTIVTKVSGNEDKGQVYLEYNSYQPWTPKEYQIWRQLDNETEFSLYQTIYNLDSVLTFNNATDDGFNQCYRVLAIRDTLNNVRTDSSWSNIACVNFKNKVKIYNTFTPNSNDINSTFYVDNIGLYPDNEVYIFNRWGARVYYRRAYNNDWDGENLPSGTYFYIVRVEGDEYKGYVFIAR